jgi:hypothetical protein
METFERVVHSCTITSFQSVRVLDAQIGRTTLQDNVKIWFRNVILKIQIKKVKRLRFYLNIKENK